MRSENEVWSAEREVVAARLERIRRRREKLDEVNELPRLSQRLIGRVLWFLNA